MKFFLVELEYTVPLEILDKTVPAHREFLQIQYDKGVFLLSGPKEPRVGGLILARANSLEELQGILINDPFSQQKYANYKYTEFHPVKLQPYIKQWVEE
ncbi:YciI family protein [Leptospira wolffii]|uniref:YciI family protein n=1 Tax=Leptospira wolffii TaxID=409998 RepID=A0A2M9ZFW1_9LEPT|nr:YciI family protein [Leptospira wolffii]EPG64913.1 hypothetical protein LEP1GSC061_3362 [Leptospira wolffii serovar Khorat str. Khorat-H2]PJZ67320.1 hypothetical protein CH371_04570 [Leptospira wolffii]TGL49124.1 hypothetical protein EHQ61_11690 [Leptospira wolffii]